MKQASYITFFRVGQLLLMSPHFPPESDWCSCSRRAELDERWRRKVTDVRSWFVFAASELARGRAKRAKDGTVSDKCPGRGIRPRMGLNRLEWSRPGHFLDSRVGAAARAKHSGSEASHTSGCARGRDRPFCRPAELKSSC